MGLFERIFGAKKPVNSNSGEFKMLTPYSPVFSSYNGQLYENELVRAVIHANATHISKLSVTFTGHGAKYLEQRLKQPNAFQTWSQFMYRLATVYYSDNTVFIIPVFDTAGRVIEIYPVLPTRCKLVTVREEPWLAFEFRDGHMMQLPVWRVAVLRRFQYRNDMFGENNAALDTTMKLIDIQNQGITEGVKSAATYRFMAQMGNLSLGSDIGKTRDDFNRQNFSNSKSSGGLILFPSSFSNIQQISSKPFVVDAEQAKLIQQNVFNYFGVNEEVLQNKAYGDKWTAYYEGSIEPFAIQFSEALTNMFRMNGELTGEAAVMASANRLQYMSTQEKLNVSAQLADRGILNRDDVREIWNLPPLPDGQGQEYIIRGEYMNADQQINGTGGENNGD